MIVAALFEPFVLYQARRDRPELGERPLIAVHRERVVHASKEARRLGVEAGMPRVSAQFKVRDAVFVPAQTPLLAVQWQALLDELYGLTPWVEAMAEGRALLRLGETEAGQLAEAYGARVGVADACETALLAGLSAFEGRARTVLPGREQAFLETLPLRFLAGLGLSEDALEHLAWLGVRRVGQLLAWRKAQLEAYLGPEAALISPCLFGPHRREVARYRPAETLTARFDFDDAVSEPYRLEPVLGLLARRLAGQLAGRAARSLVLKARSGELVFPAVRVSATPLSDERSIRRLADFALHDSGSQALGIETLELSLSGLFRPCAQPGLWPRRAALEAAEATVGRRFPDPLTHIQADDPWSMAAEQRHALVGLNDGAARVKTVRGKAVAKREATTATPEEVKDAPVSVGDRGQSGQSRQPQRTPLPEPLVASLAAR